MSTHKVFLVDKRQYLSRYACGLGLCLMSYKLDFGVQHRPRSERRLIRISNICH